MMLLTVDEIMGLHTKMVARTGGSDGLRDKGLLESAVLSAQSSFGDREIYPDIRQKAARLMYALVSNHAFVDGNKRIGVLVMLMTLKLNNLHLHYTQQELIELGLTAAAGEVKCQEILTWIQNHAC